MNAGESQWKAKQANLEADVARLRAGKFCATSFRQP